MVAWLCRTSALPDRKGTTMRQKTAVQQETYQATPTYLARIGRRCKAYRAQGVDRQVGQGGWMRSWLEALPLICCLPDVASSTSTDLFDCNARSPMRSGILNVGFVVTLWGFVQGLWLDFGVEDRTSRFSISLYCTRVRHTAASCVKQSQPTKHRTRPRSKVVACGSTCTRACKTRVRDELGQGAVRTRCLTNRTPAAR